MGTSIITDQTLTLREALHAATQCLSEAHVDSPRLAAETILAHAASLDRTRLLARLERPLAADPRRTFQTLVSRCAAGEPLAYVLGHREFYGLDFAVDARVLIPRPETERLVETALEFARSRAPELCVADIGTGSGAIAVSLAAHLPHARIIATDLSRDALDVARVNARRHHAEERIEFRQGDLLSPIDEPIDVLAANLPYVTRAEWLSLPQSIRDYEPELALQGGSDGLDAVRRLLWEAPRIMRPAGLILMEIGATQSRDALDLAQREFPAAAMHVRPDYAGLDRLLVIHLPPQGSHAHAHLERR